jgi:hypothetical protein
MQLAEAGLQIPGNRNLKKLADRKKDTKHQTVNYKRQT